MNRRDALKSVALGAAAFTSAGVLAACAREHPREATSVWSSDDQALAEAVADTLLPDTPSSPGARAAGVGATMTLLLADCYDVATQRKVVSGLAELRSVSRARHGADFASLDAARRAAFLREIDAAAKRAGDAHWFHALRELSLRAYFSSEIGMTRALRYDRVPGKWIGCTPLAPNQPAWG